MTDQGVTVIFVEFIESRIDFVFNLPTEILHRQDTLRVPAPIFSVSARRRAPMQGIITVSARWGELNGFRLVEAMLNSFPCFEWIAQSRGKRIYERCLYGMLLKIHAALEDIN